VTEGIAMALWNGPNNREANWEIDCQNRGGCGGGGDFYPN